jgi:hypothetical protein
MSNRSSPPANKPHAIRRKGNQADSPAKSPKTSFAMKISVGKLVASSLERRPSAKCQ